MTASEETHVEFPDNRRLIALCGVHDQNLNQIETGLGIQIARRGNRLVLLGDSARRTAGNEALKKLYARLESGRTIEPGDIDAAIRFKSPEAAKLPDAAASQRGRAPGAIEIQTRRRIVEPRTPAQTEYVKALLGKSMVFGIGPAGTGKTYLAVAVAVSMYLQGGVDRIVLSRPAVEAGERLGFLPGDMKEKIDPYMQPLYDALYDFLPGKQVDRLIDERRIEIAPLAFMRGRTLASSFVVLDEAQNATRMQMKMFLTRLGVGSRMAVTGDITQIDLPKGVESGLVEAQRLLAPVPGIAFRSFSSADVVRNALVGRIIDAYASG